MRLFVVASFLGAVVLTSCGSNTEKKRDFEPIIPPPLNNKPTQQLASHPPETPALPQPDPQAESIFRRPDVTNELPEEKSLLSAQQGTAPGLVPVDPIDE